MSISDDEEEAYTMRPLGLIMLATCNHQLAQEAGRRLENYMRKFNQVIYVDDDGLHFRDAETIKVEVVSKPSV